MARIQRGRGGNHSRHKEGLGEKMAGGCPRNLAWGKGENSTAGRHRWQVGVVQLGRLVGVLVGWGRPWAMGTGYGGGNVLGREGWERL